MTPAAVVGRAKMELTLVDFRCHSQATAWFPAQALTLLQGPSGGGKSTLLAALRWCLYGKVQNYAPTDKPKAKTQVWARFWPGATGPTPPTSPPALEIMRQGKPSLIEVTIDGTTYAGAEAEAEIQRNFGTMAMYLATSCLEQGERAHLLSLPQSERLELLNHLSYLGDDPGRIIDTVQGALKADKAELAALQAVQDQERKRLAQLEARLISAGEPTDLKVLDAQIAQQQTAVREAEQALRSLQVAHATWRERQAVLRQRHSQLAALKSEQGQLPALALLEEQLRALQIELTAAETATLLDAQLRERDHLRTALAALPEPPQVPPTKEAITAAQAAEAAYNQHLATATKLNIAYDAEAIAAQRDLITDQLAVQPLLVAYDELEAAPVPDGDQDVPAAEVALASAKTAYTRLHEARDVQHCPCITDCPHSVRVQGGRVVSSAVAAPTDSELAEAKAAVARATERLTRARIQAQLQKDHDRLQAAYDALRAEWPQVDLATVRLTTAQQGALQRRLGLLESIKVLALPAPTATQLAQQREAGLLKARLVAVEASLPAGATYSSGQGTAAIQKKRATLVKQRDRHLDLASQIQTHEKVLAAPSEPEPEPVTHRQNALQTAQEALRRSQDLRAQQVHVLELLRFRTDVEDREVTIKQLSQRISQLNHIQAEARTLAQELLDTMLVAINDSLADIVSRLFDDPIEVQLRLQRQLKSREASRAEVGLTIRYRNGEYNGLGQLSGGEADRVSLAVLLALSQHSTVPILLLDEVTAALNEEYRERVFAAVRDFSAGKAVVCIGHEEVAGHFDHLLELGPGV